MGPPPINVAKAKIRMRYGWLPKAGWAKRIAIIEDQIPEGLDAVKEVVKCLQYCRKALA